MTETAAVPFTSLPPVKFADVKAGDRLVIDDGFTCRGPGEVEIKVDEHGLYFDCCAADEEAHEQGTDAQVDPAKLSDKHYLDGQEDDDGALVGMARPIATEAAILARLNAGESYDEGTPLNAAILAHCRTTGADINWTDARGNVTCFGGVEGRAQ